MEEQLNKILDKIALHIHGASGWIKLLGILSIIGGITTALSVVGIVVAWIPIWMGVILLQVASKTEEYKITKEPEALEEAMSKLKTYFVLQGVVALVGIIATVIGLIIALTSGLYLSNFFGGMSHY